MINSYGLAGRLLLAAALLRGSSFAAETQTAPPSEEQAKTDALRKPFDRFDTTVELRPREGMARRLRVVMRNWIIDNRRQIARFPEEGFLIVQLRAGKLTTTIDGKRDERTEDEFWTVPVGSVMSVETGNDSAIIQTVAIRE
jgi:hypothetical protein